MSMTQAPQCRDGLIYKIETRVAWEAACATGAYHGSADDLRDGFIHFSAAHQLEATARKYFSGQAGLVLIAFAADDLAPDLTWEASRGGDLFPHLYAGLATGQARWVRDLALGPDGAPLVAQELAAC